MGQQLILDENTFVLNDKKAFLEIFNDRFFNYTYVTDTKHTSAFYVKI